MRTVSTLLIFLLAGPAVVASAQYPYPPAAYYGGYGGYRHASTAEEGIQRGFADIVRSAGAANLMNSEAAKNYEDARRKNIDNRMHATQTYFQMREVNRQARAAERGPRPTQQDLIRFSDARKPNKLSASEVDPLTGNIAWPSLLRGPSFQADREKIDQIFAERAKNNGYLSAAQLQQLDESSKIMLDELKKSVRDLPPQAYSQSRSFLTSLAYDPYL